MPQLLRNDSAHVITIVNVLIVPGHAKEVPDEYLALPGVQDFINYGDLAIETEEPPINVDAPHATQSGSSLHCTMGNWKGHPDQYAYQWFFDGEPVSGGIAADYPTQPEDAGKSATCVVTATNNFGSTAAPESNAVVIGAVGVMRAPISPQPQQPKPPPPPSRHPTKAEMMRET